jgi:hypothetical protein
MSALDDKIRDAIHTLKLRREEDCELRMELRNALQPDADSRYRVSEFLSNEMGIVYVGAVVCKCSVKDGQIIISAGDSHSAYSSIEDAMTKIALLIAVEALKRFAQHEQRQDAVSRAP